MHTTYKVVKHTFGFRFGEVLGHAVLTNLDLSSHRTCIILEEDLIQPSVIGIDHNVLQYTVCKSTA